MAPHFELVRGTQRGVLGALPAETAERLDVRVLVWAGAPLPAFHRSRGEVAESIRTLTRATRIRCESDPREHPFQHDHFALRWKELTGETLADPPTPVPCGEHTVQVIRTVAEDMYERLPHGEFRILEAYTRALRSARELVYLENQFLWSPEIVRLLADKLRNPPSDHFRIRRPAARQGEQRPG